MNAPNGLRGKLHANPEAIEQLVRGLRALDDSRTSRAIIIRDMSLRLLFIAYLIDLFFSFGFITTGAVIGFGAIFFLTQAYITIKFQRKANYSLQEWLFLYKNRSRLSKAFLLLGVLLIVFLAVELVVLLTIDIPEIDSVQENIIQTVVIMFFMATFIVTTLLEEISSTIVRYRVRQHTLNSIDDPVLDTETDSEESQKYRKLALDILTDVDVLQPPQKSENEKYDNFDVRLDNGRDAVTTETQSQQAGSVQSPRQREALRQSAIEKLEEIGADTDSIALGPEELDVLTEEEVAALLPDSSPQKSEHTYRWEVGRDGGQ